MVELCRNFSRGAFKVRNRKKEKYAQANRNHRAEGEWIKRVWNGRASRRGGAILKALRSGIAD
jgi:hypothetical protein